MWHCAREESGVTEATIGFDLRSTAADPTWTEKRRTSYLLRRDVASVRSVDAQAWMRPPGLSRGPGAEGLWAERPDLLAAAHAVNHATAILVRITAFPEDEPETTAGPAFSRSGFIGFDVADYFLVSGLTNCGYRHGEEASLAPAWAPLLNQWHLFDRMEDAEAFADVVAQRVPEHAPFYAYGLYELG
jgi:hypothetical protein